MKDWTLIKGILIGGGGITVSELQLAEAWISLLIKSVSLVIVIISALIYWRKYKDQEKKLSNKSPTLKP